MFAIIGKAIIVFLAGMASVVVSRSQAVESLREYYHPVQAIHRVADRVRDSEPVQLVEFMFMGYVQRKVLVFVASPCGGPGSGNPALIAGWVREKNIDRMRVVCKADCTDCKLQVMPKGE